MRADHRDLSAGTPWNQPGDAEVNPDAQGRFFGSLRQNMTAHWTVQER
jgi:hypothetical protein